MLRKVVSKNLALKLQVSRVRRPIAAQLTAPVFLQHRATMSSQSTASPDQTTNSTTTSQTPSQTAPQLRLESPSDNPNTHTLDLSNPGGQTVKLDHLGPLVVNVDGTLSRIANWENMAPIERENTVRILGKRNKARLEALKAKEEEESGAEKLKEG